MIPTDLFGFGNPVGLLLKVAASLAGVFYIIFAFVVVKQVNKMTDTLEVGLEAPLRFIALLHLLFSIVALVAAVVIL